MLASGIQRYLDLPVVDTNRADEHTVAKQTAMARLQGDV
jgi:hypothetical protein